MKFITSVWAAGHIAFCLKLLNPLYKAKKVCLCLKVPEQIRNQLDHPIQRKCQNKLGLELCQAHVRLEFGYVELSLDLPNC